MGRNLQDRLGLTNNPRKKLCRPSRLAACGHTVLPKIGPVIALRRRTDYQFSPNWLSGAEDELSQPQPSSSHRVNHKAITQSFAGAARTGRFIGSTRNWAILCVAPHRVTEC